jgi:hypothetical protein
VGTRGQVVLTTAPGAGFRIEPRGASDGSGALVWGVGVPEALPGAPHRSASAGLIEVEFGDGLGVGQRPRDWPARGTAP